MKTSQNPIPSGNGPRTTATQVLGARRLDGRFVIVTGGYAGIGLETTRVLSSASATVIVPARSPDKALAGIPRVELEALDLFDPPSIDAFAARFLAAGRPIHLLVNNAGIMAAPLVRDSRGFVGTHERRWISTIRASSGVLTRSGRPMVRRRPPMRSSRWRSTRSAHRRVSARSPCTPGPSPRSSGVVRHQRAARRTGRRVLRGRRHRRARPGRRAHGARSEALCRGPGPRGASVDEERGVDGCRVRGVSVATSPRYDAPVSVVSDIKRPGRPDNARNGRFMKRSLQSRRVARRRRV